MIDPLIESLPEDIKRYIDQLERMRTDFVANVSHELRTPLTVINGYCETLIEDSDPSTPQMPIYQHMKRHCQRMEHIIQDLLFLSHLENDGQPERFQNPIDMAALLSIMKSDAHKLNESKQHQLTFSVDSTLKLIGNLDEIKSLILNLMTNAIKYTPAHGRIHVCWQSVGQMAHFSIEDNGIGIEQAHIPRLTERFYRVDRARSRESGGTGLGLAIVKHILSRHQGQLVVSSEVKQGSTFTCIFPKSQFLSSN